MYLRNDGFSGYDRSGQQIRQRGLFLILATPTGGPLYPVRAMVRKVALRQFGHFMMGSVNLGGKWYTVSGAYGSDGLPLSIPANVWDAHGAELPRSLYDAWNNGASWNDVGSEAPAMREWALANLSALRS